MAATALAACGGGGGDGAGNSGGPANNPPPPPKTISGIALLGPVVQADVDVQGTTGLLVSGTTAADGSFGPLSFSGNYNGPLRIVVSGTATSTWTCDSYLGCPGNFQILPFGTEMTFDGELEAVLPSATSSQFVAVSTLSHLASARTDRLGGLTTGNVDQANGEIANLISTVLKDSLDRLSVEIGDDFATVELFDIRNPSAAGGVNDARAALLSLLNSGLAWLAHLTDTTASFLTHIGDQVAAQPVLPVSTPGFFDPSLESFAQAFLLQSIETANAGDETLAAYDALFAPYGLWTVVLAAIDTQDGLPFLAPDFDGVLFEVDAASIANPVVQDVPVRTSTGAPLGAGDIGAIAFPNSGGNWLSASVVMVGDTPNVRLAADNAVLETLADGEYTANVDVFDNTGQYRRGYIQVSVRLDVAGSTMN